MKIEMQERLPNTGDSNKWRFTVGKVNHKGLSCVIRIQPDGTLSAIIVGESITDRKAIVEISLEDLGKQIIESHLNTK
jgi:hypothetical protein